MNWRVIHFNFLNVSITEVPGLGYKDWKTQFPPKNRLSHLYVGQVNYIYITMQCSPWDPEVAVIQWAHRPRVHVLVEARLSWGCERRGQVIYTYTFKSRAQPLWGSVVWPQRSTTLWKRLCPQFPKCAVFQEIAQQWWMKPPRKKEAKARSLLPGRRGSQEQLIYCVNAHPRFCLRQDPHTFRKTS